MPNPAKEKFLADIRQKFGNITKLANSNSLFDICGGGARVYIRYSKVHGKGVTFYGLRKEDLKHIEGRPAFLVFLWDNQDEPLFVPFAAYEQVFKTAEPASDGQYKAQIQLGNESTELYLARAGKFNLEGLSGWDQLSNLLKITSAEITPELSHSQVQTILSAIGASKGYDIWVPRNDRGKLDPTLLEGTISRNELPSTLACISAVAEEIDVVWLEKGSNRVRSLFEIEHTTPIYSALLRFNDVHLAVPDANQSFQIIAQDSRRPTFVRQLNRPTFRASGLNQICTFLEYRNVFAWFQRLFPRRETPFLHLGDHE